MQLSDRLEPDTLAMYRALSLEADSEYRAAEASAATKATHTSGVRSAEPGLAITSQAFENGVG